MRAIALSQVFILALESSTCSLNLSFALLGDSYNHDSSPNSLEPSICTIHKLQAFPPFYTPFRRTLRSLYNTREPPQASAPDSDLSLARYSASSRARVADSLGERASRISRGGVPGRRASLKMSSVPSAERVT